MVETAIRRRRIPVGTVMLAALVTIGFASGVVRFALGLGATTSMTDARPWGFWVAFNVMAGVAFSAGAFTVTTIVYIFNLHKYKPLVRPALLTGFIGYLIAFVGLVADLGRPFNLWNIFVHMNLHSLLFEVGASVVIYTTIMALEFLPILFEAFNRPNAPPARLIRALIVPLAIAGATISTLHQNSLGAMLLVLPYKVHPLWYSPILPVFYYVSAITLGLATVVFVSSLSARAFKRSLEMHILSGLGRAIPWLLGGYLVLKLGDLLLAGELGLVFQGNLQSNLFLVELLLGVVAPMVLLSLPKVRRSPARLFWSVTLVVASVLSNRLIVMFVALTAPASAVDVPSWMEFAVTIGLISAGILAFMLASRYLPIFPEGKAETHFTDRMIKEQPNG